MTVSVQKNPGTAFCRLRTPPGSRIRMRITSRVLVPWHGAELLQSALDALTEGIGLTSTDPAFFDGADLADGAGFGNGWVGGRLEELNFRPISMRWMPRHRQLTDHGVPGSTSRKIEGGHALCVASSNPTRE